MGKGKRRMRRRRHKVEEEEKEKSVIPVVQCILFSSLLCLFHTMNCAAPSLHSCFVAEVYMLLQRGYRKARRLTDGAPYTAGKVGILYRLHDTMHGLFRELRVG